VPVINFFKRLLFALHFKMSILSSLLGKAVTLSYVKLTVYLYS